MVMGRSANLGRASAILLGVALVWTPGLTDAGAGSLLPMAAAAASSPRAWQHGTGMLAQSSDESEIQQVGENSNGDVEALDEGAPPVTPATESTTKSSLEDIELLDQGAPPAAAPAVAAAPVVYSTAPADSVAPPAQGDYLAPATTPAVHPAGFSLPEGFGSGNVHVSTGRGGFPPGLEDCHVGAVTGRAYVGISCGGDNNVVGHAPSFQDFPFVTDASFPFDADSRLLTEENFPFDKNDSVFVSGDAESSIDGAGNVTVVSAGTRDVGSGDENAVTTDAGNSVVERTQRSQEREPRVRVSKQDGATSGSVKSSNKSNASAESASGKDKSAKSKQKARAEKKSGGKARSAQKSKGKAKAEKKKQNAKNSKSSKRRDDHRNSRKN